MSCQCIAKTTGLKCNNKASKSGGIFCHIHIKKCDKVFASEVVPALEPVRIVNRSGADKDPDQIVNRAGPDKDVVSIVQGPTLNVPKSFVSGLLGMTVHYSSEYNKRIYIMGERHTKSNLCTSKYPSVSAYDLFFYLLNSTSKLIDVFIEIRIDPVAKKKFNYIKQQEYVSSNQYSFMLDVRTKLAKDHCFKALNYNDSKCELYENHVRFHATDVRKSSDKFMRYLMLLYRINKSSKDSNYLSNLSEYKEVAATSSSIQKYMKKTFQDMKINKQISAIDSKYSRIIDVLHKKIHILEQRDYSDITYDSVKGGKTHINSRNLRVSIEIMDLYLLARMFRNFKDTSGNLNGECRNIIIYVGNTHAENYRKLLDNLGFETEFKAKAAGRDICLDISEMKVKWV